MIKKAIPSLILGFIFIFALGTLVLGDLDTSSTTSTFNLGKGDGSNATLYKAGTDVTLNFTIVSTGINNITNITITFDTNNYTFISYIGNNSVIEQTVDGDLSTALASSLPNVTYWSDGSTVAYWGCYNTSEKVLTCENLSDSAPLYSGNETQLRIVANFTITSAETEVTLDGINITTQDDEGNINMTTVHNSIYLDGQVPRITELNVTDGNYTLVNGTNLDDGVDAYKGRFDGTAPLTITATVTDIAQKSGDMILYYFGNESGYVPGHHHMADGASAVAGTIASMNGNSGIYTWTIPTSAFVTDNTTTFNIVSNDTLNHLSNATVVNKGNMSITINTTIPKILGWNITDGTNTLTSSNSYILGDIDHIMQLEVSGLGRGQDNDIVQVYYGNTTSQPAWNETIGLNNLVGRGLTGLNATNLTAISNYGSTVWQLTIPQGFVNDTQRLSFLVKVKTTDLEDYNYTTYNLGTNNLGYNLTADSTAPTPTISTTDSDSVIDTSASITYTCSGTDATSGVASYKFQLDKPGELSAVSTTYSTTSSYTFTGVQTNKAGAYTAYCYVKDTVGNVGSKTAAFNTQYGSSGGSSGSSSGSSSSSSTTTATDMDFTKIQATKISITKGATKRFTLDGTKQHNIRIDKVTSTTATITLSSEPITIELTLGESRLIDLDEDGTNDIKVTLHNINNNNAEITIEKLEKITQDTTTDTTDDTTKTTDDTTKTTLTKEKPNLTWLWILIIVVVIAIGLYFFFKKK